MVLKRIGVVLALIGLLAGATPATPAVADGAASTRNIILGGALAAGTLLIINHNRKVHQRYDELSNARNQAQAERDQAYASYQQEAASSSSYRHQLALANRELASYRHTVAVQHGEILKLRHQVSMSPAGVTRSSFIQPAPAKPPSVPAVRVASLSYGWGTL